MADNRNYTGREISSIRQNLVDKINTLTDKWTDRNASDLGMVFVEFIASVGDFLSFYMDKQALETYIDTAVQEKNIRSLLRVMNYRVPLWGGAKGVVRVELEFPSTETLRIPRYTIFQTTTGGVQYCTSKDFFLHEGDSFIDLDVMQGAYRTMQVTKKSIQASLTGRRVYLGSKTVAEGSVQINQNNVVWEEVDDVVLEYQGGYYYSLHRDSEGQVYLLLPNNYLDVLPTDELEEVVIQFQETIGTAGVVDTGKITLAVGESPFTEFSLADDNAVKEIYNTTPTYGAWDEIDLGRAKVLARNQAKTMDRYILLEDYRTGAETEDYVMTCKVADWKTPSLVDVPYLVKVWAVDWSGNSLGDIDAKTLKEKLESKGVSTIKVEVQQVERVPIDLSIALVIKTKNSAIRDSVRNLVEEDIRQYFEMENMDFGKKISINQIVSLVMGVSNYIEDCVIISPETDMVPTEIQFPYLNSLNISIV